MEHTLSFHDENNGDNPINKQSLNALHEQQLTNGINNIHNTIELVNVFGGIDKILTDQLSNQSLYLGRNQLTRIHQILTTPEKDLKQNRLRLINDEYNEVKTSNDKATKRSRSIKQLFTYTKNKFGYSLVKSDTYIHSLFTESISSNILYVFHSKPVQISTGIIAMIYLLLLMIGVYSTGFTVFKILCALIFISYFTFQILSVNKTGLKLIICTFEFWLKIIYSIVYNIALCVDYYVINRDRWEGYGNIALQIFESICWAMVMTLALGCISLFDAVKIKRYWKISVCFAVAVISTLWLIGLSLKLVSVEADASLIDIGFGITVSLTSIIISTTRIICIFAWKQAIVIWMSGLDKCSILYYNPYIKWISDEHAENVEYAIAIDRAASTSILYSNADDDKYILNHHNDANVSKIAVDIDKNECEIGKQMVSMKQK